MGGAYERKAKQWQKTKEQSEAIKKKKGKGKYVKNAKHLQTGIFRAESNARSKISNAKKNTKVFGFAFYKKRTGVGRTHKRNK